jgi:Holliday junction resolvase
MTNDNRKVGTSFERKLCLILSEHGFWCHNLAQNSQGQPFDVIAARNGKTYPIDCKVCSNNLFKLERVEQNQASAMYVWWGTGNGDGWFALQLSSGEIYMICFPDITTSNVTKSVLSEQEIRILGVPLEEWVRRCW